MIFKLVRGNDIVVVIKGKLDVLVIDYRRRFILHFSIELLDNILLELRLLKQVTQSEYVFKALGRESKLLDNCERADNDGNRRENFDLQKCAK